MGNDVREAAERLARAGYWAIPLFPGRKQMDLAAMGLVPWQLDPRSKRMKHVLFEGTLVSLAQRPASRHEAGQWFFNPRSNIGVVTGSNGLVVLDFDDRASFELFAARNRALVDEAPAVRSPRGCHLYMSMPKMLVSSSLYMGLRRVGHLKSLGGYVVYPPSALAAGGRYEWQSGITLLDKAPPAVASLASIGLAQLGPMKAAYDRLLGRGGFKDG